MSLTVILDLFSGRLNPSVELHAETEATIRYLLAQVQQVDEHVDVPEPPGLGYRGIVVSGPGFAAPLRVYAGGVSGGDVRGTDRGQALERRLLGVLKRGLPSEDWKALIACIGVQPDD